MAASFDINQFIKAPDSASIYGTPKVVGTTSFNPKFDGKNDIQFFKGVSQLKVGDSIKIAFDLFVKTDKTKVMWPTYLIAKGITTTGDLIGHLCLGAIWVSSAMNKVPDFPKDLAIHLIHIILSHHERLDWGAAVVPKTKEAILFHMADNRSAKMHQSR